MKSAAALGAVAEQANGATWRLRRKKVFKRRWGGRSVIEWLNTEDHCFRQRSERLFNISEIARLSRRGLRESG